MEIVLTLGARGLPRRRRAWRPTDGCDVLFVAGGDGTLNEALNGARRRRCARRTSVRRRSRSEPATTSPARWESRRRSTTRCRCLLEGREIPADLGEVNGRVFANISGGGYIAEVSEAVTPQMKTVAGRLAYLVGGAQALLDFEPVRVTATAAPGGERFGTAMYAFAVCNARLIGGGKLIAPHAVIDDGLLDLCVIDGMPTLEFVALLRRVAQGSHVDDRRVRYLQVERAGARVRSCGEDQHGRRTARGVDL